MTYKELLDITAKHPNPFWSKEQHDKEFEYRYKAWVEDQKQKSNTETDKTYKESR